MRKVKFLIPTIIATVGSVFPTLTSCNKNFPIDDIRFADDLSTIYLTDVINLKAQALVNQEWIDYEDVDWTLTDDPESPTGCVLEGNQLTVGTQEGTIKLKVTSKHDSEKFAEIECNLQNPVQSVSIIPLGEREFIHFNKTKQFQAIVTSAKEGLGQEVRWKIVSDGTTGSTITESGLFTAGTHIGRVRIQAASILNPWIHSPEYEFSLSPNLQVFSFNGYNGLNLNEEAQYSIDYEISPDFPQDCEWSFDPKETNATFDANTHTIQSGDIEGEAEISIKFGNDEVYSRPIYICRNFGEYESVPEIEDEMQIVSFHPYIVSCKTPIADGDIYDVTMIGTQAFMNTFLKNITIPKKIKWINSEAFLGSRLKTVNLAEETNLQKIDQGAFSSCYYLQKCDLSMASSLTEIGQNAFVGCKELTELILPKNCKISTIDKFFLDGCEKMTSLFIPNSVHEIYTNAFLNCTSLTEINFGGTIQEWEQIERYSPWYENTPLQVIHCTNGDCDPDAKL